MNNCALYTKVSPHGEQQRITRLQLAGYVVDEDTKNMVVMDNSAVDKEDKEDKETWCIIGGCSITIITCIIRIG